jgi:hypothetical protein
MKYIHQVQQVELASDIVTLIWTYSERRCNDIYSQISEGHFFKLAFLKFTFVAVHVNWVRLCLWTAATTGPTVHTPGNMIMQSHGRIILMGKTEEIREKHVPLPMCPPHIPHGLKQLQTQASAVRGQWLIAWAMALVQVHPYYSEWFNYDAHLHSLCLITTEY